MMVRWRVVYTYMAALGCLSFCAIDWCLNTLQEYQLKFSNLQGGTSTYKQDSTLSCKSDIFVMENLNQINKTNTHRKTFKFYIYDLPSEFNANIIKCKFMQHFMCVDFTVHGFGSEILPREEGISYLNSSQFSLAVIIHSKLKTNRLRTWNPEEADIFYIPAYFGLIQLCYEEIKVRQKFEPLIKILSESLYMKQGKPHFSTLDLLYIWLPYDLYIEDAYNNITFLTMEAVNRPEDQEPLDEIVVPYLSYGHYLSSTERVHISRPISQRTVFILLPIGNTWDRDSERGHLTKQFSLFTELSYKQFMVENNNRSVDMVLYFTNECSGNSTTDTIPWMQNSVFCLQPRGDTDSRKSFYDSVMSGCIPVIMPKTNNPYPFQDYIQYENFSIILPFSRIDIEKQKIYGILSKVSQSKILDLQYNLHKISQYLQYTVPIGDIEEENDALNLIFNSISDRFNLPYDKKALNL